MQAIQTAIISAMAADPIRVNPARALGLRLQIGSRKLSGNVRDTAEMKLAHAPIAKSKTSAITPIGRPLFNALDAKSLVGLNHSEACVLFIDCRTPGLLRSRHHMKSWTTLQRSESSSSLKTKCTSHSNRGGVSDLDSFLCFSNHQHV